MTCVQCNEKTLYDKTIARRVTTASRGSKRAAAGLAVMGLFLSGSAAALSPATAAPDFAGFTTHARATPLRIEIHEPAIPVPATPQLEFNFSYTKVDGASGPIGTARGSALWPGDAVGEGLKTFGEQLGLPGALTDGGYPVQVNAQTPGDTASQTQEFIPGNTGKAITTDKKAVAKVGYGTTGDVAEGGDDAAAPPNLLDLLKDPAGLLGILTPTQQGKPGDPTPSGSPLGALGALISVSGMESISSTTYDPEADTVVASATARLGSVGLVGGLIKLTGVEVVSRTVSNIAGGAKTTKSIDIGSMSIAGQKFGFSGKGIVAQGKETAIPGLPDAPAAALKALGVSIELGESKATKDGPAGSLSAEALRITVDTAPLLTRLPKLPLADLIGQLPDLPGQAAILKGLILALGDAHPRVDLVLGQAVSSAQTVASIDGGPTDPVDPGDGGTGGTPVDGGVLPPSDSGEIPADSGSPITGEGPTEEPVVNPPRVAASSKLPPLGSVPMALILGGILLASGLGWYIRRAGIVMFGGANTCAHGLTAGIPDLRKV